MKICELTNNEFKSFSAQTNCPSIYQTINYAFTMNEEHYDTFFLGMKDNGIIKAAALILVTKINGFKYAICPRGFLLNYEDIILLTEFTKQLKKYLGKKEIVAVKLSPSIIKNIYNNNNELISENKSYKIIFENLKKLKYYHLGYNNYFEALKPRYEAVLDITKKETTMFENIDKDFRAKIKKADNDGIKIYHGAEKHLEYLYEQTKDKYPRGLNYFKELFKFYGKDQLIDLYFSKLDTTEYLKVSQNMYTQYEKISRDLNNKLVNEKIQDNKVMNDKIFADQEFEKYKKQLSNATNYLKKYPNGIILSTALVIKWQDEVYLIIDGYNKEYKSFNAKHLLLWKLINRYSKLGYKKINLGGIVNPDKVTEKYKGLNEFKLKFNPKIIEYAGDFELITNTPLYFMYQKSTKINNIIGK